MNPVEAPAAVTPEVADSLADEAMALAERQAALDAELLEALKARAKETGSGFVLPDDQSVDDLLATEAEATEPYRPMNRSERRAAVAQFKANLKHLPRAKPVVNPTIVPKAKRRKRRK